MPPLRRDDVTREIDLIEEVARIDGLERLPATLPARRGAAGQLTHAQRVRRAAEDAMVGRGLHEIVGWSFTDPGLLDRLRLPAGHPLRAVVTLENPLSEEQSIMRPTLLGSLLDAARHNVARDGPEIAIFESGTVYRARSRERRGPYRHARAERAPRARRAARAARSTPRSWRGERLRGRLLRRQGAARSAARTAARELVACSRAERWPFLHPGRSAAMRRSRRRRRGGHARLARRAAPARRRRLGPASARAAFAIDLGKLAGRRAGGVSFEPFGAFPDAAPGPRGDAARGASPPREVLRRASRDAGGEMLGDAEVFDVYSGEQVGEGRRSLALALSFRALRAHADRRGRRAAARADRRRARRAGGRAAWLSDRSPAPARARRG